MYKQRGVHGGKHAQQRSKYKPSDIFRSLLLLPTFLRRFWYSKERDGHDQANTCETDSKPVGVAISCPHVMSAIVGIRFNGTGESESRTQAIGEQSADE